MKQRHNTIDLLIIMILLTGIFMHYRGGASSSVGVPACIIGCMAVSFVSVMSRRGRRAGRIAAPRTEVSLPRLSRKEASEEVGPTAPAAMLGPAHRNAQWGTAEAVVDGLLDAGIAILRTHLGAHTAAVFFPTLDGGYSIRRFRSDSDLINREAVLYPGVGVIGSFLKDGLTELHLREIVNDSATLYYYTGDAGIRSLMASPIRAGGIERGFAIVDSTSPGKFSEENRRFLTTVADLLGPAIFSCYMYTEHKLQHGRLAAMSSMEKDFFRDLSRASIVEKIAEIVPSAVPSDRLTLSMKNDDGTTATLHAATGPGADSFERKGFSLRDKTLASVVYANNLVLSRNYSPDHYETRYYQGEPRDEELRSFVAVPLGIDRCHGLLLVESRSPDAYDESCLELLGRLSTSAGLAIEKMLVFEKANELATHDGLTGLSNHRTFQQLLADEITRAIRYNEPLSMVIGDIDHFKRINDTWGHPFGDIVLKGVSAVLRNSIRQDIDTVARYGGEEFALILVKTDSDGAAETAERIRAAVSAVPYKAPDGADVTVTMSFGIAEYRKHARRINELIARTDKALYRAKENGRDRVEVF